MRDGKKYFRKNMVEELCLKCHIANGRPSSDSYRYLYNWQTPRVMRKRIIHRAYQIVYLKYLCARLTLAHYLSPGIFVDFTNWMNVPWHVLIKIATNK